MARLHAPTAFALALLPALAACAAQPTPPAPVRAPARTPETVCLGCGLVSAREPGDLPRWRYTVQMDDGTTSIVESDQQPRPQVGARVRVEGGRLLPR